MSSVCWTNGRVSVLNCIAQCMCSIFSAAFCRRCLDCAQHWNDDRSLWHLTTHIRQYIFNLGEWEKQGVVRLCVCVCVCVCVCACVCVCVRSCVCVGESEGCSKICTIKLCVCVCVRERERESVYLCTCGCRGEWGMQQDMSCTIKLGCAL